MKSFALFLSVLPSGVISALANAAAWLIFDVVRFRRELILSNIATVFPDMPKAERLAMARTSLANFALTALEFLRSVRIDISAHTTMKDAYHMQDALKAKQGAYVLCLHMGSWEAMGSRVTRSIAPAHVLVKKVGGDGMNRLVTELRMQNGFYPVLRKGKGDGFRAIVTALSRHEIIGFVMDQARPGEPRLPFFGKPAKTNTSFAAIWLKKPAPIIPAFARRTGVGRHVVEFLPPLQLTTTGDAQKDVLMLSTRFNEAVEEMIRLNPTQYFWLHNRWK